MDVKAFPALIVGVVVALVLAGATLPIWADTLATEDTFNNVGYYEMTYTEENNITAVWDHSNPNGITINGEFIELTTKDMYLPKTILCGDDWLIRYSNGGQGIGYFVQYYGPSGSSILASVSENVDMSITCNNGTYSIATTHSPAKTATGSYTYLYSVSKNGNFVMKDSAGDAYINANTPVVAMGISNVGNVPSVGVSIEGNINDGFSWVAFRGTGITFTNENVTYSEVSNYEDLYKIEKLTATATDGGSNTADLTYNYFIVPAEVTAERSVSMSGPLGVLVGVLPLLIVAGLVTGAVVWFINRKG